ncbi:5-formyltetrahydrofolate cyclo-ligase [Maudiozyma humilis]|uniref:5-formyltetrahydrofolate cyclo-ligase n=1 Tax=Maudiozyma humilis TaxID=51915 RepID=A0AAV5S251_MAUHU|nr:5-formyltetrahydrofolate cyclo-ligase [Kazachstania humilis]
MSATPTAKKELRRTLRAALSGVSRTEVLQQSHRVQLRVQRIVEQLHRDRDREGKRAEARAPLSVGLYLGMTHQPEVDTDALARWLLQRGDAVWLPRCLPAAKQSERSAASAASDASAQAPTRPHLAFLPLPSAESLTALQPQGKYRLREPTASPAATRSYALHPAPLDILVVPCVGFHPRTLARIGWGAGYYDEFLERYRRVHGRVPLLVGVCLEQQLSVGVVGDARDWAMDAVVSGGAAGAAEGSVHVRGDEVGEWCSRAAQ